MNHKPADFSMRTHLLIAALFGQCCMANSAFAADCNSNGIMDDVEIAQGSGADCNTNGLLDECEAPAQCDDGNACTVNVCSNGSCIVAGGVNCNDGESCTFDFCDAALGCRNLTEPDGLSCSDGDASTINDQCQSGVCVGVSVFEEPNDTIFEATITGLVDVGSVMLTNLFLSNTFNSQQIPEAEDVDLFQIQLPVAGQWRLIETSVDSLGSDFDGHLRLFDTNGVEVASNDDANYPNPDPAIRTYLHGPGRFYIGVSRLEFRGFDPLVAPDRSASLRTFDLIVEYELSIDVSSVSVPISTIEPNEDETQATPLTLSGGGSGNANVTGEFIGDGPNHRADVDVYKVTVGEPSIVTATVSGGGGALDTLDPVVQVTGVAANGNATLNSYDAQIRFAAREVGEFFIAVRGSGNVVHPITGAASVGDVGPYVLTIDVTPAPVNGGVGEPNDSIPQAVDTGLNGYVGVFEANGVIGDGPFAATRGDVDVYKIGVLAGDSVRVEVNATSDEYDPVVILFDGVGRRIAANDNDEGSRDSLLVATVDDQAGGAVYAMVLGAGRRPPTDPLSPTLADPTGFIAHDVSDFDVIASPGSEGPYAINISINQMQQVDVAVGASPPNQISIPVSTSGLFAAQIGGADDMIVEIDPASGAIESLMESPTGQALPAGGLTVIGETLYLLGAGQYPTLYAMSLESGAVVSASPMWMGSGYFGDLAALGNRLFITDVVDQSIIEFDVFSMTTLRTIPVRDQFNAQISGPIAASTNPDRLILSDYAREQGVMLAVDPFDERIDQSFAEVTPCPCNGDVDGDMDIDGQDMGLVYDCRMSPFIGTCIAADINCDGVVSSHDAVRVTCMQMGGTQAECCTDPFNVVEPTMFSTCGCSADFDGDGDVDSEDFFFFLDCMGSQPSIIFSCHAADLNCDGQLTSEDGAIRDCQDNGPDNPPNPGCCLAELGSIRREAVGIVYYKGMIVSHDGETLRTLNPDQSLTESHLGFELGVMGASPGPMFGDADGDGDVDTDDLEQFPPCMSGPDYSLRDSFCPVFDFHGDGDVDLDDFSRLTLAISEDLP